MDPQDNNNFFGPPNPYGLDPYAFTNPQANGYLPDFPGSGNYDAFTGPQTNNHPPNVHSLGNYASNDPPQTSAAGMAINTLREAAGYDHPNDLGSDDVVRPPPPKLWMKTPRQLAILMASFEKHDPLIVSNEEIDRLSTLLQLRPRQVLDWWKKERAKRREAADIGRTCVQLSEQVKSTIDAVIRERRAVSDPNLKIVAEQVNLNEEMVRAYVLNTYKIIITESGYRIVTNICFADTLEVLGNGTAAAALEPAFRSIMTRLHTDLRAVLPTFPLYSVHPTLSSPLAGLWANLLAEPTPRRVLRLSQFASPWGDADSALLIIPDNAPINNETKSVYNLQDEHMGLLIRKLGLDDLEGEKQAQHQSVLISCLVPDQMSAKHGILDEYLSFTKSILCISTSRVCITLGKAANDAVHELLGDDMEVLADLNFGGVYEVFIRVSLQYLTKQDKLLKRVHRIIFGFPRLTELMPKSLEDGSVDMIDNLRKIECVLNTAILLAFGHVARPSFLVEQK